jgi:hypothetical protein
VQRGYKDDNLGDKVGYVWESEEKSQLQEYPAGRDPPFGKDLSTEAEKQPLSEPSPGNY